MSKVRIGSKYNEERAELIRKIRGNEADITEIENTGMSCYFCGGGRGETRVIASYEERVPTSHGEVVTQVIKYMHLKCCESQARVRLDPNRQN